MAHDCLLPLTFHNTTDVTFGFIYLRNNVTNNVLTVSVRVWAGLLFSLSHYVPMTFVTRSSSTTFSAVLGWRLPRTLVFLMYDLNLIVLLLDIPGHYQDVAQQTTFGLKPIQPSHWCSCLSWAVRHFHFHLWLLKSRFLFGVQLIWIFVNAKWQVLEPAHTSSCIQLQHVAATYVKGCFPVSQSLTNMTAAFSSPALQTSQDKRAGALLPECYSRGLVFKHMTKWLTSDDYIYTYILG